MFRDGVKRLGPRLKTAAETAIATEAVVEEAKGALAVIIATEDARLIALQVFREAPPW